MVSVKWLPLASLAANGYHLRPMDARAWMVRLVLGVGLALALAEPSGAQTPTPTATPTGAPKILLAFDASGSMLTDDGNGTRKIDAAKDAAVSLLDSLPDSTRSACGSTAARFRAGRSGPPAGTPSWCSRSGAWIATGPRPSSRSAPSGAAGERRSPTRSSRPPATSAQRQRTIVLVSDGKDTCEPPSPCSVAQRIAKGGVEMRIQAIGSNVDPKRARSCECVASAGGGVYRDATDAESLREKLSAHHPRAARVLPRGKAIRAARARARRR